MRTFFARLLDMFRRHRRETLLDEEVRAHLDLLAADYERRGMTADDARFAARYPAYRALSLDPVGALRYE